MPSPYSSELPTEVVDVIVADVGDDSPTLLAMSSVCKTWFYAARRKAFGTDIVFKDERAISELPAVLLSSALSAFTFPTKYKRACFRKIGSSRSGDDDSDFVAALAKISVEFTVAFHVAQGEIPPLIAEACKQWTTIRHLGIAHGVHTPARFFTLLSSFPNLESLWLEDFTFLEAEEESPEDRRRTFTVPRSLTKLSLSHCSVMTLAFLFHRGKVEGLQRIKDLHVHSVFEGDVRLNLEGLYWTLPSSNPARSIENLSFARAPGEDILMHPRQPHALFPRIRSQAAGSIMKRLKLNLRELDFETTQKALNELEPTMNYTMLRIKELVIHLPSIRVDSLLVIDEVLEKIWRKWSGTSWNPHPFNIVLHGPFDHELKKEPALYLVNAVRRGNKVVVVESDTDEEVLARRRGF
ncbi:hypothetical protein DFP72DRAFT_1163588 [Ephemerocybe angulata]|uniref:F-box domain-containing protein n=1 Tax=Ephemerocybe angulata TaxID=980116 RepID=A0A8H6IDL2_9AGAR|nr:hypothetical protein DFP72DRAFT_1163588 [Tulosesus angulatus]